ncbi:MAG: hypothetical protein NTV94_17645, partial [Planctomycetota bacterium]|nr:hypothetical protein [Planctomycetota bacterium]
MATTTLDVADHHLSQRLEAGEAQASKAFCEAAGRLYRREEIFVHPAAGGWALLAVRHGAEPSGDNWSNQLSWRAMRIDPIARRPVSEAVFDE